jgi:hypothetical protein
VIGFLSYQNRQGLKLPAPRERTVNRPRLQSQRDFRSEPDGSLSGGNETIMTTLKTILFFLPIPAGVLAPG